jgi:hypothetical protein
MTDVFPLVCCLLCLVAIGFVLAYRRNEAWLRSISVGERSATPPGANGPRGIGTPQVFQNDPMDEYIHSQLASLDAAAGRSVSIEGDACPAARKAGILR